MRERNDERNGIVCERNFAIKSERNEQSAQTNRGIHFIGEFDPGSGRTLAACLIHASRARKSSDEYSGARVSNA